VLGLVPHPHQLYLDRMKGLLPVICSSAHRVAAASDNPNRLCVLYCTWPSTCCAVMGRVLDPRGTLLCRLLIAYGGKARVLSGDGGLQLSSQFVCRKA